MATRPTEALTVIPQYNLNPYDEGTNPYGFDDGGHIYNHLQSFRYVVEIENWLVDLAAAVDAQTQEAVGAAGASGTARDLAQKWASNPEDVVVSGGAFSALHHARKAAASAAAAATFDPAGFTPKGEAETTVRGGAAGAYDTLKKLYDWAVARLGEKLNLTGGTMTGQLTVPDLVIKGTAFRTLFFRDADGNEVATVFHQASDSKLYLRAKFGNAFSVLALGQNDIEWRGSALAFRSEVTDLSAHVGNRVIRDTITTAGLDSNNPDLPYFRRSTDSAILYLQRRLGFTPARQLGGNVIGLRWESPRIIGNVDNAVEKSFLTVQDDDGRINAKFENTRLTGSFFSGTNGSYDAPSGAVITGYTREAGDVGRVGSIRGKYLQSFSPSRGWVGAYNEG